jgi:hypothetical protein
VVSSPKRGRDSHLQTPKGLPLLQLAIVDSFIKHGAEG